MSKLTSSPNIKVSKWQGKDVHQTPNSVTSKLTEGTTHGLISLSGRPAAGEPINITKMWNKLSTLILHSTHLLGNCTEGASVVPFSWIFISDFAVKAVSVLFKWLSQWRPLLSEAECYLKFSHVVPHYDTQPHTQIYVMLGAHCNNIGPHNTSSSMLMKMSTSMQAF